jgi:hypothetical protein
MALLTAILGCVLLVPGPAEGSEDTAVEDRYEFLRRKTLVFHDFIALRVPERWTCEPNVSDSRIVCHERDAETGVLYVGYDVFRHKEGIEVDFPNEDDLAALDPALTDPANREVYSEMGCYSKESTETDIGDIMWVVREVEENGNLLRIHWAHYFVSFSRGFVICHFDLVVLKEQLHDKNFLLLVLLMGQEVQRAWIGVPPELRAGAG